MPAKVIYRSKEENFSVNNVVKEIKDAIINYVGAQNENMVEVRLEVVSVGHGIRPFGNNGPNDYIDLLVSFGKQEWKGLGSMDVAQIARAIETWAKGLPCEVEKCNLNYGFDPFHSDGEFPSKLRFFGEPCKEFKHLCELTAGDVKIDIRSLYNVRLFGKRGVYDECGDRHYTAYNPEECKKLIKLAKKGRVSIKKFDEIENLEESIRYETECYGNRMVTLVAS